jgi:hypothetical protein
MNRSQITKGIGLSAAQKLLLTATVAIVAVAGTGIYPARSGSISRDQGQAVQPQSAPVPVAGPVQPPAKEKWNYGPEVNGLRAAVGLEENQELTGGQPVTLRFHIRNQTNHNIQLYTFAPRDADDELSVFDATGRPMPVGRSIALGEPLVRRVIIGPGDESVLEGPGLVFLVAPGDAGSAHQPGYSVKAAPGQYAIRFRLRFREVRTPGDDPLDWHGSVEAGVVIKVKAHAATDR